MAEEPIIIPVQLDFSGMEEKIREEQAKLRAAFARTPAFGNKAAYQDLSFGDIAGSVNRGEHDLAALRGAHPALGKALDRYQQFARTGQTPEEERALKAQQTRDIRAQHQLEMAQRRTMGQEERALQQETMRHRKQALSEEREQRAAQARALSVMGAFAIGNMGPLKGSLATMLIDVLTGAGRSGGGLGALVSMGGRTAAQNIAASTSSGAASQIAGAAIGQAVGTRVAGAMAGAEAAPAAAEGAGLGAGLTDMVGGLLGGLGAPIAALLGTVGVAAFANAQVAELNKQREALSASIALPSQYLTGSSARVADTLYGLGSANQPSDRMIQSAWRSAAAYNTPVDQMLGLYQQMGQLNVPGINVTDTANTAAAAAKLFGMTPQQAGNLVGGNLVVGGNMSPEEAGRILDLVVRGSDKLGISMGKANDVLETFQQQVGMTQLTLQGSASLLAIQGSLGRQYNAGQIMAPLGGATGVDAMRLAGFLGISQGRLSAEQSSGDYTSLFKQGMQRFQQVLGPMPKGGDALAEWINKAMAINTQVGAFDLHGLGPGAINAFWKAGTSGRLGEAQSMLSQGVDFKKLLGSDFRGIARTVGTAVTSDIDAIKIKLMVDSYQALRHIDEMDTAIAQHSGALGTLAKAALPDSGSLADWAKLALFGPVDMALANNPGAVGNVLGDAFGWVGGKVGSVFGAIGAAAGNSTTPWTGTLDPRMFGGPAGARSFSVPALGGAGTLTDPALIAAYMAASKQYGVPLSMLLAQGADETHFTNPTIPNSAGAVGIAQFIPSTIAELNSHPDSPFYHKNFDPTNPLQAIMLQAYYDQELIKAAGGSYLGALRGYGPGDAAVRSEAGAMNHITVHVEVQGRIDPITGSATVVGRGVAAGGVAAIAGARSHQPPHPTRHTPPHQAGGGHRG